MIWDLGFGISDFGFTDHRPLGPLAIDQAGDPADGLRFRFRLAEHRAEPRSTLNGLLIVVNSPRPADQQTDSQENGAAEVRKQEAADGGVEAQQWRAKGGRQIEDDGRSVPQGAESEIVRLVAELPSQATVQTNTREIVSLRLNAAGQQFLQSSGVAFGQRAVAGGIDQGAQFFDGDAEPVISLPGLPFAAGYTPAASCGFC